MSFYPLKDSVEEVSLKLTGSTLIVPLVSFANLAQLSMDLLISNLDCQRVGRINDEYLYPFVSSIDAKSSDTNDILTGLEVYYNKDSHLTLIQQRSPILPNFSKHFIEETLNPFIKQYQFSKIIVLNSSNLIGQYEKHMKDNVSIYYSINEKSSPIITEIKDEFVRKLSDSHKNLSCLTAHVFEGDNFNDGVVFYKKILDFLNIDVDELKIPFSWESLYGDKPIPVSMEEGIYG